jgi:transaldolase
MESNTDVLKVKLFADGADLTSMIEMAQKSYISGLTTNPTLMKKAGITDYFKFAKEVLQEIPNKPISFEVFSDELKEMEIQAEKISSWGENVYVKIPITNTRGETTSSVISNLAKKGIKINVTAIMTAKQVGDVAKILNPTVGSFVSIFAGRIADTGRDPVPIVMESLAHLSKVKKSELIWASPRELLNVFQANESGCHIITATSDILAKINLIGYDLNSYSLDTVRMFYDDAQKAGFVI